MKKKIAFITALMLFVTSAVGSASWITNIRQEFKPELTPSGLTEYLDGLTGTSYIFDNGATANGYTAISSDPTYDSAERTINLGYANKEIVIDGNAYFTHVDSQITYSESEYNGTNFHVANGGSQQLTLYKSDKTTAHGTTYYSNKSNAASSKTSSVSQYTQWINWHYNDHLYTNYDSSGNTETLIIPSKRLYTIKLVGDVTLSANMTMSLGALVGITSGSGFAGPVIEGEFVVLDLNGHTLTISQGATLNAYGYVIDSSVDENGNHLGKIVNYGTIYSAFIVENYSGGGNTVATGAFGTAPFTIYSIPYLSCRTIFHSTSYLKCPTSLYPNSEFSKVVVNMIGPSNSNSLIEINSGATVEKDTYNDPVKFNTAALYAQNFKVVFTFNGDVDVKTLKMSITVKAIVKVTKNINMAEFGFTLPSYIHLRIESGTTSVGMLVDFMPGSTLFVDSDATVEFTTLSLSKDETLSGSAMTTDGGVRMLSLMTAETGTCYDGVVYGAGSSYYNKYRIAEAALNSAGNEEARATIEGNIIVTSTNDKHWIGGKINLSDSAKNYIESYDKFNVYAKSYDYYAYISGTDLISSAFSGITAIQNKATDKSCASYTILPLVSYGKVVKPQNISSLLSSNTTYDFSEGVFFSDNKSYAFIPTNNSEKDTSGSIVEVSHSFDTHSIVYNGKAYSFFRNMFVENSGVVDNNLYVCDNLYSAYSSKNYYMIDTTNNSVNYTYQYTATGTTDTANYTSTRSRTSAFLSTSWGSWSSWSDWSGPNNIVEGTETTTTTNYKIGNASISTYKFSYSSYNFGDFVSYKDNIYLSLFNRPIFSNKFIVNDTNKYYQIGIINLSIDISESVETTEWMIDASSETIIEGQNAPTTNRWGTQTHTQKKQATATRNHNEVSAQTWSANSRPMYAQTRSTCIKWNSSLGIWIKA